MRWKPGRSYAGSSSVGPIHFCSRVGLARVCEVMARRGRKNVFAPGSVETVCWFSDHDPVVHDSSRHKCKQCGGCGDIVRLEALLIAMKCARAYARSSHREDLKRPKKGWGFNVTRPGLSVAPWVGRVGMGPKNVHE